MPKAADRAFFAVESAPLSRKPRLSPSMHPPPVVISNANEAQSVPSERTQNTNVPQSTLDGSRIINRMEKRQGTITAPVDLNIQPHEMAAARSIAAYGMDVEFRSVCAKPFANRVTSFSILGA